MYIESVIIIFCKRTKNLCITVFSILKMASSDEKKKSFKRFSNLSVHNIWNSLKFILNHLNITHKFLFDKYLINPTLTEKIIKSNEIGEIKEEKILNFVSSQDCKSARV